MARMLIRLRDNLEVQVSNISETTLLLSDPTSPDPINHSVLLTWSDIEELRRRCAAAHFSTEPDSP